MAGDGTLKPDTLIVAGVVSVASDFLAVESSVDLSFDVESPNPNETFGEDEVGFKDGDFEPDKDGLPVVVDGAPNPKPNDGAVDDVVEDVVEGADEKPNAKPVDVADGFASLVSSSVDLLFESVLVSFSLSTFSLVESSELNPPNADVVGTVGVAELMNALF